jgi:hypothetical protein
MKLDINQHASTGKVGNIFAVLKEALEERQSSDTEINRELTPSNRYFVMPEINSRKGAEIAQWFVDKAKDFRTIDKHGHEKKLRSDANIAFAGIIKPEMEWFNTLSEQEQKKFLSEAVEVVNDLFARKGLKIMACVWHFDEMCPHCHFFGYDPQYKICKKLSLPLFHDLNHEFPKRMREKGWPLEDLGRYDVEATKKMSEAEKEEYKKQILEEKRASKKHGKSSRQYRAEKEVEKAETRIAEAERVEAKADQTVKQAEMQLQAFEDEYQEKRKDLDDRKVINEGLLKEVRQEGISNSEKAEELRKREAFLAERERNFDREVEKAARKLLPEMASTMADRIVNSDKIDFMIAVVFKACMRVTKMLANFLKRPDLEEGVYKKLVSMRAPVPRSLEMSEVEILTTSCIHEVMKEWTEPQPDPEHDNDIYFGM